MLVYDIRPVVIARVASVRVEREREREVQPRERVVALGCGFLITETIDDGFMDHRALPQRQARQDVPHAARGSDDD